MIRESEIKRRGTEDTNGPKRDRLQEKRVKGCAWNDIGRLAVILYNDEVDKIDEKF